MTKGKPKNPAGASKTRVRRSASPKGELPAPAGRVSGPRAAAGVLSTPNPPTPAPPATPPAPAIPPAEAELVARAYRKVMGKEPLTAQERAALKRHEREKEERLRWQFYGSIPQKHWRQMSGRQAKVLIEQAERYGLPFGGPTVSLPALARALHDFLADNALKLAQDDDPLLQGGGSPALEQYRVERAALARLDRLEREGSLIPRDAARAALARVAAILRSAGEALGRQFGSAATDLLYEALDDAEREIDRSFGGDQSAADGDGGDGGDDGDAGAGDGGGPPAEGPTPDGD
jgi:hypothetical protein